MGRVLCRQKNCLMEGPQSPRSDTKRYPAAECSSGVLPASVFLLTGRSRPCPPGELAPQLHHKGRDTVNIN